MATDLDGSTSRPAGSVAVQARRLFLKSALLVGFGLPLVREALGDESPAASERPREGDRFVDAESGRNELKPGDLPLDGPPVFAWPKDPKSGVVRDGSRLNQLLLLRLDPASLDGETRGHAADGALAYSAICTHAQCPVQGWDKARHVLKCYCHNSEFDPRANGNVVFGPAPRNLPVLPVRIDSGLLVAVGTFIGRVGSPRV
jgi:Rieske Fe-S protein